MKLGIAALVIVTAANSPAIILAGPNQNAKIACHLVARSSKTNPCDSPPRPPCNSGESNFQIQGAISVTYDCYIIIADGDSAAGLAGAEFGISYKGNTQQGVDVLGWYLCADAEFGSPTSAPPWPEDGSGNVIIWNRITNCQKTPAVGDLDAGVTAILGSLVVYAYSKDNLKITKRPGISPSIVSVAGCSGIAIRDTLAFPQALGKVKFGSGGGGSDPCQ